MFTKQTSLQVLALGALSIVSGASIYAYAADNSENSAVSSDTSENATDAALAEIIVTAERREEPLSKVPISIVAFSQKDLDQQGIRSINDLALMTPGVRFEQSNTVISSGTNISIRGIESFAGTPVVGVYFDDTPILARENGVRNGAAYPVLFDLDRVEVLKGPQGTLFGAGAEGGVVRFITPTPSLTSDSGYVRSEIASTEYGTPTYEVGMATGGPMVKDQLGYRMSAYYRTDGGFVDRDPYAANPINVAHENYYETVELQTSLLWAPTDNIKISPAVHYQQQYQNGRSDFWVQLSDPGNGKFINGDPTSSTTRDQMIIPSLKVEASVAGLNIVSATSYTSRQVWDNPDYTEFINEALAGAFFSLPDIPNEVLNETLLDHDKAFTQEIRIQSQNGSRIKWTVGAFYQNMRQREFYQLGPLSQINRALQYTTGVPNFLGTNTSDLWLVNTYNENDEQIAGFGQVDWMIFDNLTLTAGLREAHMKFTGGGSTEPTDLYYVPGSNSTTFGSTASPFTPKFGVSYQATPGTLVYASAGKGFREGGGETVVYKANQIASCQKDYTELGITQSPASYAPDSTWSYELGTKNRLLDGKLAVDAAVFYTKWSNMQQTFNLPDCGQTFLTNFGNASSKGVEFAGSVRVASHLVLSASLSYADAALDQTIGGAALLGSKGDKIGGPPFNSVLSSVYEVPIGSATGYWRVDYTHDSRAAQKSDGLLNDPAVYGFNPYTKVDPATNMVNMHVGYRLKGADISLFVNNLFDSSPLLGEQQYIVNSKAALLASTFRPRTVGVTAGYRY